MKVGLITYHSAYNIGSALQAFTTQTAVKRLGYDVEIINYRMREQKEIYKMYRTHYGIKALVKDILQLPIHGKRRIRSDRYEKFFAEKMQLTPICTDYESVSAIWGKYDLIINGSDQIWNKHSLELENNDWKFMKPYLLSGYLGKKI